MKREKEPSVTAITVIDSGGMLAPRDARPAQSAQNAADVYLYGLRAGTLPVHESTLHEFARFISRGTWAPNQVPWGAMRYDLIATYRAHILRTGSAATARRKMAAIRGVLRTAYRLGQLEFADYSRAIDHDKIEGDSNAAGRYVESKDIDELYAAAAASGMTAARDLALVALLADCALRRVDAAHALIEKYDAANAIITVMGKRSKWRTVAMTANAVRLVNAWIQVRGAEPGPLLTHYAKAGMTSASITVAGISFTLAELCKRAGIAAITPHDLRRTYISDALDAKKADVIAIARQVGHDDTKTTLKYDKRGDRAKVKVAQSIPKRTF